MSAEGRRIPRPQLSSGTPKPPSRSELARHAALVEPVERRRRWWDVVRNLGDVLDTAFEHPCRVRQRWYSADRGEGGMVSKACGKRVCPACVVGWLGEKTAPAWASWDGGPVAVERFESDQEWRWARESRVIRMRGDNASVGVLVVPVEDDRVAFIPGDDGLRGIELDTAYVETLRAMPVEVEDPEVRRARLDPNYAFGGVPAHVTDEAAVRIVEEVGGHVLSRGGSFKRWEMTPEQNRLWVDILRAS